MPVTINPITKTPIGRTRLVGKKISTAAKIADIDAMKPTVSFHWANTPWFSF